MRVPRWTKRFEAWLHQAVFKKFHENCLLGDKPLFHKEMLAATNDLEAGYPIIRAEVDKIMERYDELTPFQTMSPDQEGLSDDNRWKFFFLKCAGLKFKKNISLMPETMRIVGRHKQIVSAYLSILGPGKSLPPHRGPWSGVLRAHLGVIVPEAGLNLKYPLNRQRPHLIVENSLCFWKEGEVVFFDDTYRHEAHNPTEGIRVVLFMDVLRPMAHPYDWINRGILAVAWMLPYVWVPYFRHKKWEKAFHG
jgi:aspartyl/asparaginyl beta-hydroxylase (cupin superfamily)